MQQMHGSVYTGGQKNGITYLSSVHEIGYFIGYSPAIELRETNIIMSIQQLALQYRWRN